MTYFYLLSDGFVTAKNCHHNEYLLLYRVSGLSVFRGHDTRSMFSTIYYKGKTFCDFVCFPAHQIPERKELAPLENKFFSFRVDPFSRREGGGENQSLYLYHLVVSKEKNGHFADDKIHRDCSLYVPVNANGTRYSPPYLTVAPSTTTGWCKMFGGGIKNKYKVSHS